jgi:SIR2-like domain
VHDLQRIRQDLQESLSLDKHPIALLLGAGCPSAVRVPNAAGSTDPLIPDIAGLTAVIKTGLATNANFCALTDQFIADGQPNFNVEELLSRVRMLRRIVGSGTARGLDAKALISLEQLICELIVGAVQRELPGTDTAYHHLVDWIGGIHRSAALELFTTNYDGLLEQALEDRNLPFFDGFVGSRKPFFDLRAIEDDVIPPRWTRLWKLHGCHTWRLEGDGKVIRSRSLMTSGEGLLIHPSELKYDQSRRMPYLAMIDQLRAFLRKSSAFLVTLGYAYGDDHLNEVILQGLRSNPSAAAFGLLYKDLAQERAALAVSARVPLNLSLLARDQGVIRSKTDEWAADPAGSLKTGTPTSDLGDFAVFAKFVRSFVPARGA